MFQKNKVKAIDMKISEMGLSQISIENAAFFDLDIKITRRIMDNISRISVIKGYVIEIQSRLDLKEEFDQFEQPGLNHIIEVLKNAGYKLHYTSDILIDAYSEAAFNNNEDLDECIQNMHYEISSINEREDAYVLISEDMIHMCFLVKNEVGGYVGYMTELVNWPKITSDLYQLAKYDYFEN